MFGIRKMCMVLMRENFGIVESMEGVTHNAIIGGLIVGVVRIKISLKKC